MKQMSILSLFFITLLINPVYAEIFRCTGDDGVVTFSDSPCGANAEVVFKGVGRAESLNDMICKFSASISIVGKKWSKDQEDRYFEKLKIHGKSVGNSIFNDAGFKYFDTERIKSGEIIGSWGPMNEKGYHQYTLRIVYRQKINPDGRYDVYVAKIQTEKYGRRFDPPIMTGITCLEKNMTGKWLAEGERW